MTLRIIQKGENSTFEVPPGAVLNLVPGAASARIVATISTPGIAGGPYVAEGEKQAIGPFTQFVALKVEGLAGVSGVDVALPASGDASGVPSPEALDRDLVPADNRKNLVTSTAINFTVVSGLGSGFGLSVDGTVTFIAGDGVTVDDWRDSGAEHELCALMQYGDNKYRVVGGKA